MPRRNRRNLDATTLANLEDYVILNRYVFVVNNIEILFQNRNMRKKWDSGALAIFLVPRLRAFPGDDPMPGKSFCARNWLDWS